MNFIGHSKHMDTVSLVPRPFTPNAVEGLVKLVHKNDVRWTSGGMAYRAVHA